MAVDIIIISLIVFFAFKGYFSGLMRRFCPLVFPFLGLVIGFKYHTVLAPAFDRFLNNYPVSSMSAFLFCAVIVWLGLRIVRNLLLKLLDWSRLEGLDAFLGGIFGLTKALTVAWISLVIILTLIPSSVRTVERSNASMQVLTLMERTVPTLTDAISGFGRKGALFYGMGRLAGRIAEQVEVLQGLRDINSGVSATLDLLHKSNW